MKIVIALCALLCSLSAIAQDRIQQRDYKAFERVVVLQQCYLQGFTAQSDLEAAKLQMGRIDNDAMKAYRRGMPYILKYIGPDNSQQLMYMLEGVVYYGPLTATQICTQI